MRRDTQGRRKRRRRKKRKTSTLLKDSGGGVCGGCHRHSSSNSSSSSSSRSSSSSSSSSIINSGRFLEYGSDEYEHTDGLGLLYVDTSFPGAGLNPEIVAGGWLGGCVCQSKHCPEGCHGPAYINTLLPFVPPRGPVFECNDECRCDISCPGRLVQRGPIRGLMVKPVMGKGLGLVTRNPIPRGAFVCEYAGELIGAEEAMKRLRQQERNGYTNYLIVVVERGGTDWNKVECGKTKVKEGKTKKGYVEQKAKKSSTERSGAEHNYTEQKQKEQDKVQQGSVEQRKTKERGAEQKQVNQGFVECSKVEQVVVTAVDPCVTGNVGRYANHSCSPNMVLIPVRVNHMIPLLALFTTRQVYPGEELCYNYADTQGTPHHDYHHHHDNNQDHQDKDSHLHTVSPPLSSTPCLCGAPNCRGFLPAMQPPIL